MKKLIPLMVLLTMLLFIGYGTTHLVYSVNAVSRCTALRTLNHAPPADVIIIGSSRISSAIDPVFMEQLLSEREKRPIDVERVSSTGSESGFWNGLAEKYVSNRGYPKVALIELSHRAGNGIQSDRSILFNSAAKSLDLQKKLIFSGEEKSRGLLLDYFDSSKLHLQTIVLQKAAAGFYGVLNLSHQYLFTPEYFCQGEDQNRFWPYGDIDGSDLNFEPDGLTDDKTLKKILKERAKKRGQLNRRPVTDPTFAASNVVLSELMTTLDNGQTQFYLVVVPHFDDRWTQEHADAVAEAFPKAILIDLINYFSDAEAGKLRRAWRNVSHLNFTGAAFVTRHISEQLSEIP